MGEWVPFSDGVSAGYVNSGGDLTKILGSDKRLFLWVDSNRAYSVDRYLHGEYLNFSDEVLYIWRLIDLPPLVNAQFMRDLKDYVSWLAKKVYRNLEGRKVLLSFSGGKDSLASLIVALKLLEFVDFSLHIVYVKMPFIDSLKKLNFVDRVSKSLGVDIEIVEPVRAEFRKLLERYGLPYRGFRWCTYRKVRSVRMFKKKIKADLEIVGERIWESYKRFKSLREFIKQRKFIIGGKFRPTFLFTILDVVKVCRDHNLINPNYLDGMTRVSCQLCPYKNLFELEKPVDGLEDQGFIEKIMVETWKRHYVNIDKEAFFRKHLWRFSEKIVEKIYKLHSQVEEKREDREKLSGDRIRNIYKDLWLREHKSKILKLDEIAKIIGEING